MLLIALMALMAWMACGEGPPVLTVFVDDHPVVELTAAQLAKPIVINRGGLENIPAQNEWLRVRVEARGDSAIFPKWSVNYTQLELRLYRVDGRVRAGMFRANADTPISFIDGVHRVSITTGAEDVSQRSREQAELVVIVDQEKTRIDYETLYKLPEIHEGGRTLGWSLRTLLAAHELTPAYSQVQLQCKDDLIQVDPRQPIYIRLNKRGEWRAVLHSDGQKRTCHQLTQIQFLRSAPTEAKADVCDDSSMTMTVDGEIFWQGDNAALFETYKHGVIGVGNRPNRPIVRLSGVIRDLSEEKGPVERIVIRACGNKAIEYAGEQVRSGGLDLLLVQNRQGLIRLFERPANGKSLRKSFRRINRVELN